MDSKFYAVKEYVENKIKYINEKLKSDEIKKYPGYRETMKGRRTCLRVYEEIYLAIQLAEKGEDINGEKNII